MELEIRRCAYPIEKIHTPKGAQAVVGLHGYTGYPGELALPAQELFNTGLDLFVPRYPGHGTNGKDFLTTGKEEWIGAAEVAVKKALEHYAKVSLIGHSMGGAIAVILASRYPIERVVLYAPALLLPTVPRYLLRVISPFVKRKKVKWAQDTRYNFFDERDEGDDLYLGSEYWSYLYPRQVLELIAIMDEAQRVLPQVKCDILVITGGDDATVPQDVGPLVVRQGGGENLWVHLPLATHLIPYDWDENSRLEAMSQTVAWLNS
ncbi:MAG: alpha/beta fold hydrolase [Sphaerochaetaceae bacterium]